MNGIRKNGLWKNWKKTLNRLVIALLAASSVFGSVRMSHGQQDASLPDVIDSVQPRMVKVFGAGGLGRLESWQSGFFVSRDGLVATVWSYVLDGDQTTVVLDDGQRMTAKLVGYHPQYEIALLKVDLPEQTFFNLDAASRSDVGATILAFSNLYGVATGNEKCSVQFGVVSANTSLNARRGIRKTSYKGPVIIVDAITNNPGAAGGAVTDRSGRLLGMIGRESRSVDSNLWLNYAIPAEQVSVAVDLILAGQSGNSFSVTSRPAEPMTLELLGLVLVPDVVERTPPFVDQVIRSTAAATAGIQVDDLIVEVDGRVISSRRELVQRLKEIDRDSPVSIMLQRDARFINLTLRVTGQ